MRTPKNWSRPKIWYRVSLEIWLGYQIYDLVNMIYYLFIFYLGEGPYMIIEYKESSHWQCKWDWNTPMNAKLYLKERNSISTNDLSLIACFISYEKWPQRKELYVSDLLKYISNLVHDNHPLGHPTPNHSRPL